MKVKICLILGFLAVSLFGGCKPAARREIEPITYDRPLGPGQQALRKITDAWEVPDFTLACMDLKGLREAVGKSLNYLSKPSSRRYYPMNGITHSRAVVSLKKFAELLDSGLAGKQLSDAVRENFDVYMSVGCDGRGTVLFTGYYTPIFEGSTVGTERFRYALYRQPEDLVKGADGEILGRRGADGRITKYPSRAVIESTNMLSGKELIWLGDPFEAYVAQVQGSAKIRLPDGDLVGVGYAANNGREYRSISKMMVAEGLISRSRMSLSAMIDYFKRHTDKVREYTRRNPRFVFFKDEDGPPRGSLNEPVTAMRTIATDKSIFPRGALAYIATYLPREEAGVVRKSVYRGFALDQDAGGAIRAPGRCDLYMGIGDTAGRLAGYTYEEGKLYYLFIKDDTIEVYY